MKTIVLGFGSGLEGDDLALRICKKLKKNSKINFMLCASPDDVLNYLDYDNIIILDVARNINNVQFIEINQINERAMLTLHDFDIGFLLKLLKEIKMTDKIRILAIPIGMNEQEAEQKVIDMLNQTNFTSRK